MRPEMVAKETVSLLQLFSASRLLLGEKECETGDKGRGGTQGSNNIILVGTQPQRLRVYPRGLANSELHLQICPIPRLGRE